jgi:transcriptional regulator GlxA family with amidase domain
VFLLYEGVQLLDVAGAAEVFALAGDFSAKGGYAVSYVGSSATVGSSAGLSLSAAPLAAAPRSIHTLVVPGAPDPPLRRVLADATAMAWLAAAAGRASRVASVCSGAFLLGAIGLLEGRRVTTHWMAAESLARRFPQAQVDGEALFVEDGKVWTAAGVTSGIDLALALVARDLGQAVALAVARALVLHLVRPGGQSQFSAPLSLQARGGADLGRLIPWLEDRLERDTPVAAMAEAMGMSERSFHRRCLAAFGLTPGKLAQQMRLDRARALLEDPGRPVQVVAARAGFADTTAFSKAFAKRYGASPSSYRRAFARG